jgi:hypothetical protein
VPNGRLPINVCVRCGKSRFSKHAAFSSLTQTANLRLRHACHDWPKQLSLPHPRETRRWWNGRNYKTKGAKLYRFVALKFLPDEVANDPRSLPFPA